MTGRGDTVIIMVMVSDLQSGSGRPGGRSDREFGREAIASFSREDAKSHKVGTPRRRMAGIEPATGVANHILSEPF